MIRVPLAPFTRRRPDIVIRRTVAGSWKIFLPRRGTVALEPTHELAILWVDYLLAVQRYGSHPITDGARGRYLAAVARWARERGEAPARRARGAVVASERARSMLRGDVPGRGGL